MTKEYTKPAMCVPTLISVFLFTVSCSGGISQPSSHYQEGTAEPGLRPKPVLQPQAELQLPQWRAVPLCQVPPNRSATEHVLWQRAVGHHSPCIFVCFKGPLQPNYKTKNTFSYLPLGVSRHADGFGVFVQVFRYPSLRFGLHPDAVKVNGILVLELTALKNKSFKIFNIKSQRWISQNK